MSGRTFRFLAVAATLTVAGACGRYRPALFADREIVTAVHDEQPIAVPSRTSFDEPQQVSDIYLRRPLFDVVHPLDFPTAGDVNALDEVPRSTWYDPEAAAQRGVPKATALRPTPPLQVLDEEPLTTDDALVVLDSSGSRYELVADPPGHAGLATGADVLGGYLLRSLGLHAPMAWVLEVRDSGITTDSEKSRARFSAWAKTKEVPTGGVRRVSATRWPGGIDVGVTSDFSTRSGDPNDETAHNDRRTVRAMKIFGDWIGFSRFGVRHTRDVYVGKPDEGHLVHYVVGTSKAFGTEDLRERPALDDGGGGLWWNLVTFGLSPTSVRAPVGSGYPCLGYLPSTLEPGQYDVSPPYSPFVRFTPADEYWAAKQMASAGDDALRSGIAAADLPDMAATHLLRVLQNRRRILIDHGMSVVTPLDAAGTSGRLVFLQDRAILAGIAVPLHTRYEVEFLDRDGKELSRRAHLDAVGAITGVPLPDGVSGLVVLHVRVVRNGRGAPRACDVHVVVGRNGTRIIGVRH